MKKIASSEARKNWKEILDEVYNEKTPIYITSHDRNIAALISIELLEEILKHKLTHPS